MTPPTPPSIDILALGNAIVDVLSHVDDAQIDPLPVNKGAMTLIDSKTAAEMYAALGPGVECSMPSRPVASLRLFPQVLVVAIATPSMDEASR